MLRIEGVFGKYQIVPPPVGLAFESDRIGVVFSVVVLFDQHVTGGAEVPAVSAHKTATEACIDVDAALDAIGIFAK